jgi:hypothetical protein
MPEATPTMCDMCPPDRPSVATHSYTWQWGQSGFCCERCVVAIRHQEKNLRQTCVLASLTPAAPLPINRDERTRLIAAKLAAEEEAAEVKSRNVELYNANQELGKQLRLLTVQMRELEAQKGDLTTELDHALEANMAIRRQLGETDHERARLEAILTAQGVPPEGGLPTKVQIPPGHPPPSQTGPVDPADSEA